MLGKVRSCAPFAGSSMGKSWGIISRLDRVWAKSFYIRLGVSAQLYFVPAL